MAENNININDTTTQEDVTNTEGIDVNKYITAYNELKQNSVSKDEYQKLKKENADLFNAYTQGQTINTSTEAAKVSLKDLREDFIKSGPKSNNLEYWKKALALRDATIEAGMKDPFLPAGSKIAPTNEDVECANRVAAVVKDCIDYAEGDSAIFTMELNRRTVDASPLLSKRRR